MTTTGVVPPEPRRVVLADEAEAQIQEADRELEELAERLRSVEAEVASAEQSAEQTPAEADLPESAQLTLRFVDDLISTNRERIRDLLSERYAWAGDRLVEAHAEAQEIVNDALGELSLALRERDAGRTSSRGEPIVVELLASIASTPPAAVADDAPSAVIEGLDEREDGSDVSAPVVEVPALRSITEAEREADEDQDTDEPLVEGAHFVKAVADPAEDPGAEPTVDDVVTSAVQAVLRAITEPAAVVASPAAPDVAPGWDGLGALPEPPGDLRPPAALAGGGGAASPATVGDHDDPPSQFEEFWSDRKTEEEGRPSRFRPRHVVIAMLLLVAAVIVALALIG